MYIDGTSPLVWLGSAVHCAQRASLGNRIIFRHIHDDVLKAEGPVPTRALQFGKNFYSVWYKSAGPPEPYCATSIPSIGSESPALISSRTKLRPLLRWLLCLRSRVSWVVLELVRIHQSSRKRVDAIHDDHTGCVKWPHGLCDRSRELLA